MSKFKNPLLALSLAALAAGGAQAQSLNSSDPVNDQVDDVMEATQDQFDKNADSERFGNQRFSEDWRGNVFLSANVTSGNSETADVALGARVNRTTGAWNQSVALAYEFGEASGTESKNELFALYELDRSFTDRLYGYGLLRGESDYFNDTNDVFLGFGPGYRIFNDQKKAWRVQAGPGYRLSNLSSGGDFDEAGISASSRFFYAFDNGMSITNDTDVIWSDSDTLVSNDLGLNVSVAGPLALRLGLKTDYNSDPGAGAENTDTTTTAAVVYNF